MNTEVEPLNEILPPELVTSYGLGRRSFDLRRDQ